MIDTTECNLDALCRYIARHLDDVGQIQRQIVAKMEALDYTERDVFAVQLALDEALTNAVVHGNDSDPEKQASVSCQVTKKMVSIEIEDEGSGFCPDEVPDPRLLENLEKSSGRGILLMRSYMCAVEYNTSGNRVVMRKNRSLDREPDAA